MSHLLPKEPTTRFISLISCLGLILLLVCSSTPLYAAPTTGVGSRGVIAQQEEATLLTSEIFLPRLYSLLVLCALGYRIVKERERSSQLSTINLPINRLQNVLGIINWERQQKQKEDDEKDNQETTRGDDSEGSLSSQKIFNLDPQQLVKLLIFVSMDHALHGNANRLPSRHAIREILHCMGISGDRVSTIQKLFDDPVTTLGQAQQQGNSSNSGHQAVTVEEKVSNSIVKQLIEIKAEITQPDLRDKVIIPDPLIAVMIYLLAPQAVNRANIDDVRAKFDAKLKSLADLGGLDRANSSSFLTFF